MKPAPSLDYAAVCARKRRLADIRRELRTLQHRDLDDDQLARRVRFLAEQEALERELIQARW